MDSANADVNSTITSNNVFAINKTDKVLLVISTLLVPSSC